MQHGTPESAKEITIGLSALLAFLSIFAAPGIGYGVWTWSNTHRLNDRVERLEADFAALHLSFEAELKSLNATITVIAAEASANSIHRAEHEKSAGRWIDQIINNTRDIGDLQNTPKARSDPFTGTEGDALRDRIERLEQRRGGS
jgi:hypothetical protein